MDGLIVEGIGWVEVGWDRMEWDGMVGMGRDRMEWEGKGGRKGFVPNSNNNPSAPDLRPTTHTSVFVVRSVIV